MVEILELHPGMMDCNVLLVLEGEVGVLIDPGTGMRREKLLGAVGEGLNGRSLDGMVLTHEHFDHVGGTGAIVEEFGCPVYGSTEAAQVLADGDPMRSGAFLFGSDMDPVEGVNVIGDSLEIGPLGFDVIRTPGHSPGSICILERYSRALFCGDVVFCDGGVGRWDLPGGHLPTLKESIRRILDLNVSSLYPGHGRSETADPRAQMEFSYSTIRHL